MNLTRNAIVHNLNKSNLSQLINIHKDNVGDLLCLLEACSSQSLKNVVNITDFLFLTYHDNAKVRYQIVKLIGREKTTTYYNLLANIAQNDKSSLVRREAVSSIGRMKDDKTIPFLVNMLKDTDPNIVCQAIRGLLVFKNNDYVIDELKKLINHENETIRLTIKKEFFSDNKHNPTNFNHIYIDDRLKNVTINGDVIEVLKYIPNDTIHLTFTSPPYYNARDYSIYTSYEAYLEFLKTVFFETLRVTKEGRFLIVNTSPVIVPRISRAHSSKRYPIPFDLNHILTEMGWDFIDDIIWLKPEYSVKNRVGGFQQHRKPLGYKPNAVTEYLMVYRKHTDKLLDWNIHQYPHETVNDSLVVGNFETSNVWQICPKSDKVHSAIFPPELCQRIIKYYSYVGDLVFDPFGGSGTCGRVARSLNRFSLMTELNSDYFDYIKLLDKKEGEMFNQIENKYYTIKDFKKIML